MPECRTWALSQKFASSSHQKIIFLFFLFSFCALNLLIWGGFSCLIPLNDRNEETKKTPRSAQGGVSQFEARQIEVGHETVWKFIKSR